MGSQYQNKITLIISVYSTPGTFIPVPCAMSYFNYLGPVQCSLARMAPVHNSQWPL